MGAGALRCSCDRTPLGDARPHLPRRIALHRPAVALQRRSVHRHRFSKMGPGDGYDCRRHSGRPGAGPRAAGGRRTSTLPALLCGAGCCPSSRRTPMVAFTSSAIGSPSVAGGRTLRQAKAPWCQRVSVRRLSIATSRGRFTRYRLAVRIWGASSTSILPNAAGTAPAMARASTPLTGPCSRDRR